MSPYELQVISLVIANTLPRILVEIGTFDGTTTLQMALNSPEASVVHTLDLPPGEAKTILPSLSHDLSYILDTEKEHKKFEEASVQHKIVQHFGDSASYDFQTFSSNHGVDFCFIDGGHSYGIVKNDTEKILPLMNEGGIVCWHDFEHKSVCAYLGELGGELPLTLINGTQLVVHRVQKAP